MVDAQEMRELEYYSYKQGSDKGRCSLCLEEEDGMYRVLKCSEMGKWRDEFVCVIISLVYEISIQYGL
jgi:hypothetical protein